MYRLLIICLIYFTGVLSAQQYNEYQIFQLQALSDIDKFGVYIWETDSLLVKDGLTEDSLLTYVYQYLPFSSDTLLSFTDASKLEGSPSLEIEAKTAAAFDSNYVALYTAVRFIQDVILDRDRSIRHYSGITWQRDSLTTIPKDSVSVVTLGAISDLMDDFVLDYSYINPPDTAVTDSSGISDQLSPDIE